MKRAVMGITLAASVLLLAGCGETLEERAENRDKCEALGGDYVEFMNGWTYEYYNWRCDL